MDSAKTILFKILDAIDYSEDKEEIANKFLDLIYLQSRSKLVETLPVEKQTEIKQKLSSNSVPENVESILKEYFDQSELEQSLLKTSQEIIVNYMQRIEPTLSSDQKNNLAKLAKEYQQNNP